MRKGNLTPKVSFYPPHATILIGCLLTSPPRRQSRPRWRRSQWRVSSSPIPARRSARRVIKPDTATAPVIPDRLLRIPAPRVAPVGAGQATGEANLVSAELLSVLTTRWENEENRGFAVPCLLCCWGFFFFFFFFFLRFLCD
ncbi:hypothetical protein LZ31DRAFT_248394 [Colletotrichum somersetense]|nr:hypothetical protein LZ31DRAFT_248394 [Colletotrichum somersetense]